MIRFNLIKGIFCVFILTLSLPGMAQTDKKILTGFSKAPAPEWSATSGIKLSSVPGPRPGEPAVQLEIGKTPKRNYEYASYRFYSKGKNPGITPGTYKFLEFEIKKTGPKPMELIVGLWQLYPPKGYAKFRTYIKVTDKWQKQTLYLTKTVSRKSPDMRHGYFRFEKSRGDTLKTFASSKPFYSISFCSLNPDVTLQIGNVTFVAGTPEKPTLQALGIKPPAPGGKVPYSFTGVKPGSPLVLVKNGVSDFRIFCPPTPTGRTAAGELSKYIKESTGAELPVQPSPELAKTATIVLAPSQIGSRIRAENFAAGENTGQLPDRNFRGQPDYHRNQ